MSQHRLFAVRANGYQFFVDTQRELDDCYFTRFTEYKEPKFKSASPKKNGEFLLQLNSNKDTIKR